MSDSFAFAAFRLPSCALWACEAIPFEGDAKSSFIAPFTSLSLFVKILKMKFERNPPCGVQATKEMHTVPNKSDHCASFCDCCNKLTNIRGRVNARNSRISAGWTMKNSIKTVCDADLVCLLQTTELPWMLLEKPLTLLVLAFSLCFNLSSSGCLFQFECPPLQTTVCVASANVTQLEFHQITIWNSKWPNAQ